MGRKQHITAFYVEALLLISVFIGIILMLTRVYGAGRLQSASATQLTTAVTLAGNAAEAVAGSESEEALLALLNENGNAAKESGGIRACYNDSLLPDPNGAYTVLVTWEPEAGANGELVSSRITVSHAQAASPLYTLETAVYRKEAAA